MSPPSTPSPLPPSRRTLLGAAGLGALGLAGALGGCSGGQLSNDPRELVLWYWNRSLNPRFLDEAEGGIPGADGYRLRADLTGSSNWDTKLRTSLAGRAYIPDLVMINSNVSLYVPAEDLFTDLNEYTDSDVTSRFYDWKLALGTTPSGRLCFWPVDTGPTGFYYRADVMESAGLPGDPAELATAMATWDQMLEVGAQLKAAGPALLCNAGTVFSQFMNASPERYFDDDDQPIFLEQGSAVRRAWDLSMKAIQGGISANLQPDPDKNAGWVSGRVAAQIEGAWWSQIIADTAPDTAGQWRITVQPEGPGNSGGSFLAVPTACKDPQAAYQLLEWMTTADRQATSFNDIQLFPSTPGSFDTGTMTGDGGFFGDQDVLATLSDIADQVSVGYISTYESQTGVFGTEVNNVEGGKDPEAAWDDAVAQARRNLEKRGVTL